MKIRLMAFILALVLCFSVLVACDGLKGEEPIEPSVSDTEKSSQTETVVETESRYMPEIAKKNYGDTLYVQAYSGIKFLWTEESDSSLLSEAVYQRQVNLYNHLGVEMVCTPTEGWEGYFEPFKLSVKNKDGSIDVFLPHPYLGIAGMIEGGYMHELSQISTFNFDADYWDFDFMDSLCLGDNYYLGYSDFNVMKTYVITFNKEMLEKYSDALDESVYESVMNYRWTIDKMISLAKLVYIDATGDGKTSDDTFGFSAHQWVPFVPFLMASNIKLVDLNEAGNYQVSVLSDLNAYKTAALVDKLKDLAESEFAWFRYKTENQVPIIELQTNRALMNLHLTTSLDTLLNYEITFGILPYPMFDEQQKDVGYMSTNYDTYITLPSYMRNEAMITECIELLSYYSYDVREAVFDKWLGKQAADEPDDVRMLNIIWDNLQSDFGITYSTIADSLDYNLYMLPTLTQAGSDKSLSSYVASYAKSANSAIAKYMKKINMMDN